MNVKALIKPVAVLAAVFVLLLALSAGLAPTAAENAAAEQARLPSPRRRSLHRGGLQR